MNSYILQTSKRPRRQNLNRDKWVVDQTLRRNGLSYHDIAHELRLSLRQVQYASECGALLEAKSPARPPVLSGVQADELEHFVNISQAGRFVTHVELATVQFSYRNAGEKAIRDNLERNGYKCCVSQSKPPLSEENKRRRLLFPRSHLSWNIGQWNQVQWIDESWINSAQYTRLWVTRKASSLVDNVVLSLTKPKLVKGLTMCAYLLGRFEGMAEFFGELSIRTEKVVF